MYLLVAHIRSSMSSPKAGREVLDGKRIPQIYHHTFCKELHNLVKSFDRCTKFLGWILRWEVGW
jgi:hypothetical protein